MRIPRIAEKQTSSELSKLLQGCGAPQCANTHSHTHTHTHTHSQLLCNKHQRHDTGMEIPYVEVKLLTVTVMRRSGASCCFSLIHELIKPPASVSLSLHLVMASISPLQPPLFIPLSPFYVHASLGRRSPHITVFRNPTRIPIIPPERNFHKYGAEKKKICHFNRFYKRAGTSVLLNIARHRSPPHFLLTQANAGVCNTRPLRA